MFMFQLMDDTALIGNKLIKLQNSCIAKKASSIVVTNEATDAEFGPLAEVKAIRANICPNLCSKQGICRNGICICNNGW